MTRAAEPVSSPEPFSLHLLSTRARRHPAWAAVLFAIMRCRASPDHHNPAIGIEHEQLPVILDVQRMGPSTGLPTRTCQGDIFKAYHLSHGDCKHPLLIPANPREALPVVARPSFLAV